MTTTAPTTTAPTITALASLDQPIRGTARLAGDGTLTVGEYADGAPAHWPLDADGTARHALIVGAAGAGMTCLLHSILDGAATAGAATQLIDLTTGQLADTPHPAVIGVRDTRAVLSMAAELAYARAHDRLASGDHPQQLVVLAIDGLHELTADPRSAEHLADLMPVAAAARIAVIATTADATVDATGGDLTRGLLTQHTVVMLRPRHHTRSVITGTTAPLDRLLAASNAPGIADTAPGVGYLPMQRPGTPFRAWLP